MDGTVDGVDYSAKYYAQDAKKISGVDYEQLNANLGYERKDVLTDPQLFRDVLNRAHSTFDKSKFEIVGSPVVTDDGIASGFSNTDYISSSEFILGDNSWKFVADFTTGSDIGGLQVIQCVSGDNITFYNALGVFLNNNQLTLSVIANGSKQFQQNVEANTRYLCSIEFTGNSYVFTVNSVVVKTISSADKVGFNLNSIKVLVGRYYYQGSVYAGFKGSVNLKSTYVFANGYNISSGNTTGIDIIKPNDYTVVGTPTISDDGIASGFGTNGKYLFKEFGEDIVLSDIEIICPVKFRQTGSLQYYCTLVNDSNLATIAIREENNHIAVNWQANDRTAIMPYTIIVNQIQSDVWYFIKCKKQGKIYSFAYSTDLKNWEVATSIESEKLSRAITKIILGASGDFNNALAHGAIDLNSVQVYSNGNLIYQPCLKIPYTLSKTGSKIVDAAYRDRVQDMYEQFGYAPYYTLDEGNKNVTLPMGDIYSFSGKRILVDSYDNGTDWWELYSDKTLIQGSTASTGGEINLLKPFKATNYTLTIPHTAKTTTGFTASAAGDWIARGKVV